MAPARACMRDDDFRIWSRRSWHRQIWRIAPDPLPRRNSAGASWQRLPADVRKVLEDTAREAEPDVLALAEKLDNELGDKMKAAGIAINQADKAAFVAASKDIYAEFAKEVPAGKALIDKAMGLSKGS